MAPKPDAKIAATLANVPLFAGCTKKQLRTVSASGKTLKRKDGAPIVQEGASGIAFFVLMSGSADVIRGGDRVASLLPGDFFGEMSLMLDETRNAEVVATSDAELFTFTRWAFKSLVTTNPAISLVIMKTLAARQAAG